MTTDIPWFEGLIDGGTFSSVELARPLDVVAEPGGSFEVRTGSVRVSDWLGFVRDSSPLDAQIPNGTWAVTRLVSPDDAGDLALVAFRSGLNFSDLTWEESPAGSRPFDFATATQVIIGDGDLATSVGSGPDAEAFPRFRYIAGMSDPEADALRAWRATNDSPTRRLLPTSITDVFVSRGLRFDFQADDRPAPPRVWLGFDADHSVEVVVVDLLSAVLGMQQRRMPSLPDVWALEVLPAGGRLTVPVADLIPETADISLLFLPGPSVMTTTGTPVHMGDVQLSGELVVGKAIPYRTSPIDLADDMTHSLEIEVPVGSYPVFMVALEETCPVLVRFSTNRPTRWVTPWRIGPNFGRGGDWFISTRDLVETPFDGIEETAVRSALGRSRLDTARTPFGDMVVGTGLEGDAPDGWLIGLDDELQVVALAVVPDWETIYAFRPPGECRPLFEKLQSLRDAGSPDLKDDDNWNFYCDELDGMQSGSAEWRTLIHFMARAYLND